MLRTKPRLTYKGLTIIMSNPSRLDTRNLLSATSGHLVNDFCLRPDMNIMQCDVRLMQDPSPLLPDTKCVLLLGEGAMHRFLPETQNSSLKEMRGSPLIHKPTGIVCVPSFLPQDALDIKDYESRLNPLAENYDPDDNTSESDEDGSIDESDTKKLGKTSRSNYGFWLRADVRKALRVIKNQGKIPWTEEELTQPNYIIYPPANDVIRILNEYSGQYLFFDMETDFEEQNMQCFAFSFDGITIYVVPIIDYNYRPAFGNVHSILGSLYSAIQKNILVAHNGSGFDFLVLAYKYGIPINEVYDTMLAMHRCFPDIEKSLGHGTSLWTNQIFHKSEDSEGYYTKDQMWQRMKYCGKDVRAMYLIFKQIQRYSQTVPGLEESIRVANAAIRPYLITTLQGVRVDSTLMMKKAKESDRLMEQYNHITEVLIGPKTIGEIRAQIKGKSKMFCGSNTQQVIYFHDMLGYKVMARSQKTGHPSLGKKAMYKLALSYPDNPIIQLILSYRKLQKEFGAYKFIPWRMDNGELGNNLAINLYANTTTTNSDSEISDERILQSTS